MNERIKRMLFKCTIIFFIVAIVVISLVVLHFRHKLDLTNCSLGNVHISEQGNMCSRELSSSDRGSIVKMLSNHTYFSDSLSCGFSKVASIELINQNDTYLLYVAEDGCPFLQLADTSYFIRLTTAEMEELHKILASYGLVFPHI